MGTRGAYGFYKNGTPKVTYNHFDSYPSGLGANVVDFIQTTAIEDIHRIATNIQLVDADSTPTPKQIEECLAFFNASVSTGVPMEWYALLRNAQGNLNAYKDNLKYMIDSEAFLYDPIFCEYAYIINLDKEVLELYQGLQEEPDTNPDNRYQSTDEASTKCYIHLKGTFPLSTIPPKWDSCFK